MRSVQALQYVSSSLASSLTVKNWRCGFQETNWIGYERPSSNGEVARAALKQELLSLIGQLSHMCKVVRPGQIFLSQMIKLSTVPKQLHHHVRLNHSFRCDLEWWHLFLENWNRVLNKEQPSLVVTSDASGRWGCGAFYNTQWFQLKWPESLPNYHITVKELIPVVIAATI